MVSNDLDSPAMDAALIEHDPDFWFADGSIVIIAEGVGFRVHMSLLSRHSPVFRDIFAIPRPTPGSESDGGGSYQGVPVVHVSDRTHDMRCLLHAIYDGRRYIPSMEPILFAVIAALMRLGHKYELIDIVDEAAKHLEGYFTDDFDTWLKFYRRDLLPTVAFSNGEQDADLVECVNLARLTGRTAMLPMMLYMCCQRGISNILRGGKRHTGVIERLSEEDTEICVLGWARLLRLSGKIVPTLLGATCAAQCPSRESCSQCMERLRTVPEKTAGILTINALAGLEWPGRYHNFTALTCWKGLCSICRDRLQQNYKTTQRELWDKLPSVFGFEKEELGNMWAERYMVWYEGLR